MRTTTAPIVAALLCCFAVFPARADVAGELRTFLGDRSGRIAVVDRLAGYKVFIFDLDTGELSKLSDEIACLSPLISPDGTRVVYHQNYNVYIHDIDDRAAPRTRVTEGYDPHWWVDSCDDEWIYYTTQSKSKEAGHWRKLFWPENNGVETYRIRLRDGKKEHVWDWKGSGGPSRDGMWIGSGYASVVLHDLMADRSYLLADEKQGCNPSMYPGADRVYLMHLATNHKTICYRDKDDNLLWYVKNPSGTVEWQFPEWSSHVDYATATAKEKSSFNSVWVIRISEIDGGTGEIRPGKQGMMKVLPTSGGHDWSEPHLWVAGKRTQALQTVGTFLLSPAALAFSTVEGEAEAPAPQSVAVKSCGFTGKMELELSSAGSPGQRAPTWLSVSTGNDDDGVLTNRVNAEGLAPGTYSATVKVRRRPSSGSYTVHLTVAEPDHGAGCAVAEGANDAPRVVLVLVLAVISSLLADGRHRRAQRLRLSAREPLRAAVADAPGVSSARLSGPGEPCASARGRTGCPSGSGP
jgi:hypothetical protein